MTTEKDHKLEQDCIVAHAEGYGCDEAEAMAWAKSQGCEVVYPNDDELQLDIDSDEAYELFVKRMNDLVEINGPLVEIVKEIPSKSGLPKRHVTLRIDDGKPLDVWKRIALQMFFGSDPVRESMNVLRHCAGIEKPIRFFDVIEGRGKRLATAIEGTAYLAEDCGKAIWGPDFDIKSFTIDEWAEFDELVEFDELDEDCPIKIWLAKGELK